jgi:RNA polymerase sigma-32 factor
MTINEHIKNYKDNKDNDSLLFLLNNYDKYINNISFFYYKKNYKKNIDLDDIKSCAKEALIKAVLKYDESKNSNFEYYLSLWMKAFIKKFIMNNITLLKLSTEGSRKTYNSFSKSQDTEDYTKIKNAINYVDINDVTIISSSSNPEIYLERKEFINYFDQKINKIKNSSSDLDKYIIDYRLLSSDPKTLHEISELYNTSYQMIFYNEKKIMNRIKKEMQTYVNENGIISLQSS